MNIYFVYIYRKPDTLIPFYVGYGKNNRHLDHLKEAKRNPIPTKSEYKLNTIRKILRDGSQPIIEIVEKDLNKETACELEEFLISEIGRADLNTGTLTNLTKGGDGNREWTPFLRKAMSKRSKEMVSVKDLKTGKLFKVHKSDPRWVSGELVGQNLGSVNSNCNGKLDKYILCKDPITEETFRVKPEDPRWISGELVGFNKNRPAPLNTKLAATNTHKGKPKSEEHKKKNSEAIKQLKWYCNFEINKVGRFKENTQPKGYVRVSGPHKRIPI